MRCPNCHGEIEENSVTCPMCNYIFDYDKVDLNKDLDEVSRQSFIIQKNILFIVKLGVLFFLIGYIVYCLYMFFSDPFFEFSFTNLMMPILLIILCIILIVITIKAKRRWK